MCNHEFDCCFLQLSCLISDLLRICWTENSESAFGLDPGLAISLRSNQGMIWGNDAKKRFQLSKFIFSYRSHTSFLRVWWWMFRCSNQNEGVHGVSVRRATRQCTAVSPKMHRSENCGDFILAPTFQFRGARRNTEPAEQSQLRGLVLPWLGGIKFRSIG